MRRLSRVAATIGVAVAFLGSPLTTSPSLAARTGCFPQTYHEHFRVLTYDRGANITHLSRYGISPSGSHEVSRRASFETKVTAAAELNIGGSVGAESVFAHVEGHFDVTVRSEGSHTQSGSVTVTDVVRNPTPHNKLFIAFDGVNTYSGRYRYVVCGKDQQVHHRRGNYVTFNDYTQAIIRCGSGDQGVRLFRLALRHCS